MLVDRSNIQRNTSPGILSNFCGLVDNQGGVLAFDAERHQKARESIENNNIDQWDAAKRRKLSETAVKPALISPSQSTFTTSTPSNQGA